MFKIIIKLVDDNDQVVNQSKTYFLSAVQAKNIVGDIREGLKSVVKNIPVA